jgi:hypothetical protein
VVFAAISVNPAKMMAFPGPPGRAAESILQFLDLFLTSTLELVPRQPERPLAVEFIAVGFALWLAQVAGQVGWSRQRAGHPWSWLVYRAVLGQSWTVPFCGAGVALLPGAPGALHWLVPSFGRDPAVTSPRAAPLQCNQETERWTW